jgi:hypothetical protein
MKIQAHAIALLLLGVVIAGCGGSTQTCTITANISPPSATADHALAPLGNQVQFMTQSNAVGNCPLTPDVLGVWATSNTANTSINQQGVATCLNATSTPAMITNSGKIRGTTSFLPATLACH